MSQPVDVQVLEMDIGRVLGIEADGSPIAVRVAIAVAAQATVAIVLDATGMVGYFQTGNLDIAGVGEVKDKPGSLRAPQFGRVDATGIPALAEDTGRMRWVGATGHRRHVTIVWIISRAAIGAGRTISHTV